MHLHIGDTHMNRLVPAGVLLVIAASLIGSKTRAADDPVATVDKALMTAFEKGDKAAFDKYLDPDFTWIDHDGVMVFRSGALALGMKPLVGEGKDVEIVRHP